ncbi:MAG: glycoside hydrolase family 16 protein [Colwellia sp.]|nr:glycoside hydrolase family 16 protein [Colwellia sp.]
MNIMKNKNWRRLLFSASMVTTSTNAIASNDKITQQMFDDFNYQSIEQAQKNGWVVRTEQGHPGIKGAIWWSDGISFHPDKDNATNQVMRLTSQTDGSSANTRTVQICHQRKYFEGTYAARVHFTNDTSFGPKGDQIVETFYAISPLEAPMDKNYSEMDFEYLANGGWGAGKNALFATSWETFQLQPWTKVNAYDTHIEDLAGWNTLVLQVANNKLKYYINGHLFAEHGAEVYPEVAMSLNFNLWFTPEGLIESQQLRQYQQDVDWVYFQKDVVMSPKQVELQVKKLRNNHITQVDNVPTWQPALPSYCGL